MFDKLALYLKWINNGWLKMVILTWFHEDILDKKRESYYVQDDAIPTVENKECTDIN